MSACATPERSPSRISADAASCWRSPAASPSQPGPNRTIRRRVGIEVRSVTRRPLMRSAAAQLSIADVVTAAVTQEIDRMFIPANRKSRQEQHRWPARLQQLGASFGVAQPACQWRRPHDAHQARRCSTSRRRQWSGLKPNSCSTPAADPLLLTLPVGSHVPAPTRPVSLEGSRPILPVRQRQTGSPRAGARLESQSCRRDARPGRPQDCLPPRSRPNRGARPPFGRAAR